MAVLFKGGDSYNTDQVWPAGGGGWNWGGDVEARDGNQFIYRSQYIPLSCLSNYVFSFTAAEVWDDFWYMTPIALKFRYNFSVVSDPNAQNVLHVQTYPINLNPVWMPPSSPGCGGPTFFSQISANDLSTFCQNQSGYAQHHLAERNPGRVDVTPVNGKGLNILNVAPNPASSNINLQYSLDRPATVEIRLVNLQGQLVKQIRKGGGQDRGMYNENIPVTEMASGIYMIEIITDKQRETRKVVIQR